ncbi:MAG: tetratricopeptide (TPR) repeat protein [Phenylobacterium sp.]|jgi:tetratricopeptide (TPR) repeat protein
MSKPSNPENAIETAEKYIKQQQFAQALALLQPLVPQNRQSLYLTAVCLRYQQQYQAALVTLQQLFEDSPDYARAYQEAGHCYTAIKAWELAKKNYLKAVTYNPALLASWQRLGLMAKTQNDNGLIEQVKNHLAYFADLPDVLISVTSMIHEGKLYKAENLCRHFLQHHKHHSEAMRLLAKIAAELQILDDAEFLLESIMTFAPSHKMAMFDYIGVLHQKQKFKQAFEQAQQLLALDPDNPGYRNCFANHCAAVGLFEQAINEYRTVEQILPDSEGVALSRGHAHKAIGQHQDAIDAYCHAAEIRADFGDAYWSLANLKTYRFSQQQTEQMQTLECQKVIDPSDRIQLCFALGKAFEDGQETDLAFKYYQTGNRLQSARLNYSRENMQQTFEAQKQFFNDQTIAACPRSSCEDSAPIFIVGLPRAGSTLIEQILASHSQVDGTMELQHIMSLAHQLDGRRKKDEAGKYPQLLADLCGERLGELGQDYIEQTRIHRQGAAFYTDKMPNNFRHIGLIKLILPNAKIIDARRDAMSCCFSGYKQLFAQGQEFSYDQEDIGHYYRGYVDLMDHWHQVFPGEIITVDYQTVVDDVEGQVRRVLDFLGLPFEQGCVDFHQTQRSVRTASSEQVRQPIYRSGLAPWKSFAEHLAPLQHALGDLASEG